MNEEDVRITRATAEDFNDVLKLYYEFYVELRSKQGWRPHTPSRNTLRTSGGT